MQQYSTAFNTNVLKQDSIDYSFETVYLTVSSADRDITAYPTTSRYTIHLDQEIRNIHSIELFSAILPNTNSVSEEPYLVLEIDEISDTIQSNNKVISDCFAILPMPNNSSTVGNFIHIKSSHYENMEKVYYGASKAGLSRMSISIKGSDGTVFDFGADTPSPPNKTFQTTFTFRVVIKSVNRAPMDFRNVH
jgi:hypothetical protein